MYERERLFFVLELYTHKYFYKGEEDRKTGRFDIILQGR